MHCSASASPVGRRLLQLLAMFPVPSTPERAKGFRLEHASPAQEDKKPRCRVVHTVLKKKWKGTGAVAQSEKILALAQAGGRYVDENSQQQGRQEFVQAVSSPQDVPKNSQESGSEEITSPSDIEELCDQLRGQWFILCDRMLAEGKEPMSFTR